MGVLFLAALFLVNSLVAGEIRWLTGSTETPRMNAARVAGAITQLAARPDARRLVVQFDRPVTQVERQRLEAGGLMLLSYLGDRAYFATLATEQLDAAMLVNVSTLSSASAIEPAWKLHPFLNDGEFPVWAAAPVAEMERVDEAETIVGVYVLFHRDVPLDSEAVSVSLAHDAQIRSMLYSVNGLVIEIPFGAIRALAEMDAVQWIEPALPPFRELNDDSRARTGADVVQAAPYDLDGSGVTVLVYDGGAASASHVDFGGRLTVRDSSDGSSHATHVSGTIGGSGLASSGVYKGMAPGVLIESYGFEQEGDIHEGSLYMDPGDIEADYDEAINTYGADISNNSIGTNTAYNMHSCEWEGSYGVTANLIDAIVRGSLGAPFRVVWANGNERSTGRCGTTYHTTAPPACAKNHIAVGALHSNDDSMTWFSSWGPCDDGRMRPDIVAPGCQNIDDNGVTSCSGGSDGYAVKCGTSMASPAVCGLGALLLEDFRAYYPNEPDFRNSTLKILLAHTAEDVEEPGPDYKTGYGSVRIQPAVDLLRGGNFLEAEASQDETGLFLAVVNPGDVELKITLAWDDFPGTPNVNPVLVNDLDLRVFSPSGVRAYPWTLGGLADPSALAARTGTNHVDNIEQVLVDSPEEGVWLIEVHGFNVPEGPQPFSLCATPSLLTCLPQGVVWLNQVEYACEGALTVQVLDCDLNGDDEVVETAAAVVVSDSEPAGESVLLTETGPDTALFVGSISLSQIDDTGVLLVANTDSVAATYIDADDGQGGTNVEVTDTAVIDCPAPLISNVQTAEIVPRGATITFDTDEPARGAVRYGLSCGSLTETVTEYDYVTAHVITLAGLDDSTVYFYLVEAEDEAGNPATDDNGGSCYSFMTPDVPRYFTEQFGADNDLDNTTIVFTPNASPDYYVACAEPIVSLPTDPSGGITLSLSDNDFQAITLSGGKTVLLYGTSYGGFYVGSNGYITFPVGDITSCESLTQHFGRTRVSALFDDLNPAAGGAVSWKQLSDRVAVTYQGVPERGVPAVNTFQIEMYFDGRIVLSYLDIAAIDGIVGLSNRQGLPADFLETDLSALDDCSPRPPINPGVEASTSVGTPVTVTLAAFDDGLPDPPAELTYIIATLPEHGELTDPGDGLISAVPYTLVGNGNQVVYQPDAGFGPSDSFEYMANDGGASPEGGDSNVAPVTIAIGGAEWDPVAYDMDVDVVAYTPTEIELLASDPGGDPLTYIIESLPPAGILSDPGAGAIAIVPHTLADGGNVVNYQPPCGQSVIETFEFSARDATAGSNVATVTLTVGESQLAYSYSLNDDPGWSVEGQWAFGQPTGQGSHDGDPSSGYTGQNVYGYNLAGDYPDNMSSTLYLTTTAIDCLTLGDAELRFRRWLGVESSYCDHASIQVSNNGADWVTVWENGGTSISENSWSQQVYDISEWADGESTVYVRWGMGPTDSSVTYPGWNIDDIEIWAFVGPAAGDQDDDGDVDLADFQRFAICFGADIAGAPGCACANVDGSNHVVDADDWTMFAPLMTGPE